MNAPTPMSVLAAALPMPGSNAEFLAAIFGAPGLARPRVCMFPGAPGIAKARDWDGYPWSAGDACDGAGLNWYFSLATHVPGAGGRYSRRNACFDSSFGILLDDVGVKGTTLERLRTMLQPSIAIETSPGSYHAIYLFEQRVAERWKAEALVRAAGAAGMCDKRATGVGTRYGRLPFGVNGKHSPPFACRLVDWHPELRYTVEQIKHGLQLPDVPATGPKAHAAPSLDKWNALDDARRARLVEDLRSALAWVGSDDRDVWVANGHRIKADLPEEIGRPLWEEYSWLSEKCDDDALDQWETFDPDQTGHAAVFAAAQALGWVNPSTRVEIDAASVGFGVGVTLPPGARLHTPAEVEAMVNPPPVPLVPPPAVPRFALMSGKALCNRAPLAWRIKGVLPAEGLAVVFGAPGSGKSFLTLDAAAAIAEGAREWFGYRVKRAPVVYAALEGQAGFRNRAAAWIEHHGRPLPDDLQFMVHPFDLTDPAQLAALAECIPRGAVTIIDTLNRAALGRDENSPVDMGLMLQGATALQTVSGGLVLLVHHSGKDASKGLRGHSSLNAAVDASIEVERAKGSTRREWSMAKVKEGDEGGPLGFELQSVDLGHDEDGDRLSSCVVVSATEDATTRRQPKLSAGNRAARVALMEAGATIEHGVHVDEWRKAYNLRSTADSADSKRQAFKRARAALYEAGAILVADDIYRVIWGSGEGHPARIASVT